MRYSLIQSLTTLITEASKMDSLINKLKITEPNAKFLNQSCGKLSIWMANKIIDAILDKKYALILNQPIPTGPNARKSEDVANILNVRLNSINVRQTIISIMDYIRVGLSGNIKTINDLSIEDIAELSREWHESLEVGAGSIDYKEEHEIILDFRDENGEGFYWADLGTNYSEEECERMGHCGRSSYGGLVSLRKNSKIPGTNHTLNKSYLTAAIGNGSMYQLKGPKNSKPEDKYHKYIIPLFYLTDDDGDYFITGFSSEYESSLDFKLTDLSDQEIRDIYENRPDLFDSLGGKFLLNSLKISGVTVDLNVTISIDPDDISSLVSCDRRGRRGCDELFISIIDGEMYSYFDSYYNHFSSIYAVRDMINDSNLSEIKDFINKKAEKENLDISELDLDEAAKELDIQNEILSVINMAYGECESNEYANLYWNKLKECLEEYGKIIRYFHEGEPNKALIEIDLYELFRNIPIGDINTYSDNFGDDYFSIIKEAIYDGNITPPDFSIPDYFYADVSDEAFNESLEHRISWDLN